MGASRITWNWTATTDGAAGNSSMVIPNTLLIALRGFARKATAADSTWLAAPAVSVATTVRITLPASTVTVKTHVGKKQRSSWRKLSLTESAFASYSSTVPTAFSTKVTSLADTISLVAPGGNDGGGGCGVGGGGGGNTGGLGGGSRSRREPQSLQSVPNAHIDPKAFQPPSWQTVSPAVPQVSRQIIGGGEAGGGCGGNGGGDDGGNDGGGGVGGGGDGGGRSGGVGGNGGRGGGEGGGGEGAGSTVTEPSTPVKSTK